MKKAILILNDYLSHFWFVILLLVMGSFSVIFFTPLPSIISLSDNGYLSQISLIISNYLFSFFLPLGGLSIIVALINWLKNKDENSNRGFISLIFIILSLGLMFLMMLKVVNLDHDVKSGNLSITVIGGPENIKSELIK